MTRVANMERIERARALCRILSAANVDGCEIAPADVQEVLVVVDELLAGIGAYIGTLPIVPTVVK